MLSLRELARNYLEYYKSGGIKYSLQNDAAILQAIEGILRKQFEAPQILLTHIEAALARQSSELKGSVEWGSHVAQLTEALEKVDQLRREIGLAAGRPSRLEEFPDQRIREHPELLLIAHLAPYLQSNVAIDVGARTGDATEALLEAGYSVFAFEPARSAYQKLAERFAEEKDVLAFDVAIGKADAPFLPEPPRAPSDSRETEEQPSSSAPTPDALAFSGRTEVSVRSLESLRDAGEIPAELGLVRIAIGRNEYSVVQGLGDLRPSVLIAEFRRGSREPEKREASGRRRGLFAEARERGYAASLAIYRLGSLERWHFVSNTRVPEGSRGHAFFFVEASLLEKALHWCALFL